MHTWTAFICNNQLTLNLGECNATLCNFVQILRNISELMKEDLTEENWLKKICQCRSVNKLL